MTWEYANMYSNHIHQIYGIFSSVFLLFQENHLSPPKNLLLPVLRSHFVFLPPPPPPPRFSNGFKDVMKRTMFGRNAA